jgi:hypothetical protein
LSPDIQAQLARTAVADLPTWKIEALPPAEQDASWLQWLESADVFFSAPLDLDFLLLEHYPGAYMSEEDAPEGDTSEVTSRSDQASRPANKQSSTPEESPPTADDAPEAAGESSAAHGLAVQVLGRKGLDPTHTYTPAQLALFAQYRSLFQLGSKPAAHLLALSELTDEQLLSGLPPVMQRLIGRASHLLTQHGE